MLDNDLAKTDNRVIVAFLFVNEICYAVIFASVAQKGTRGHKSLIFPRGL